MSERDIAALYSLCHRMPLFNMTPNNTAITTDGTMRPKFNKHLKQVLETVSDGLRKIYKQKLLPLEEYYRFHDFHSPALGKCVCLIVNCLSFHSCISKVKS